MNLSFWEVYFGKNTSLFKNIIQMKKYWFFTVLFLVTSFTINAQKPQEILGVAKENKSKEYYELQSALWEKEILKNPKNAYAYWQFYKAKRSFYILNYPKIWMNDQDEIFQKLKPIIARAKKNVGNSFEYPLLEAVNTKNKSRFKFLEKAYQIDPKRKESYESLLIHYTLTFQNKKATDIAQLMLESNYYSNASMKWSFNTLQTIAPNGIFIANGDMDTMPKWVMQAGNGFRKDILVISKWSLALDKEYRQSIFKKINIPEYGKTQDNFTSFTEYIDDLTAFLMKNSPRPVYMSCGTSVDFFKKHQLQENIYLVGTAFVFSKKDFDNIAVIRDNFENKYHLDYLIQSFQVHAEDGVVKKYMNPTYLPGLMKLKKYFEKKNQTEKVNYYQSLMKKIAKDSGREKEIMSWFNN